MKIKKISIIIPCFNMGVFLEQSIKSVINQSFKNFDLYLVNNGSNDNSLEIMKSFKKDKRIIIINNKKKTPRGKSINDIIKIIKTKWVATLDADDLFLKDKIKKQVKFIEKNPQVKLLSCLGTYTLDGKKTFGETANPTPTMNSCFKLIKHGRNVGVAASGILFDKNIFLKLKGYRPKFWPADDNDLYNRFAENGFNVYVLPNVLFIYRMSTISSMANIFSFLIAKKKARWVKHSLNQRLKKIREISYKKYLLYEKKEKVTIKISNLINDCSDYYFRNSVVYILNKNYFLFFYSMLVCFILNPKRLAKKILSRI